MKPQPWPAQLDSAAGLNKDLINSLVIRNALEKLEESLRETLQTVDFGVLLDVGSGPETAARRIRLLCSILDEIVNPKMVAVDALLSLPVGCRYPKLAALVQVIRGSDGSWEFDLVVGEDDEDTLFTASLDMALRADAIVNDFNRSFHHYHSQVSIRDILPAHHASSDQDTKWHDEALKLRDRLDQAFERLFSMPREAQCQSTGHKVLLELLDPEETSREAFQLYVSACSDPDHWLEARLESVTQASMSAGWVVCDQRCAMMQVSGTTQRHTLCLAVKDQKMHLFDPPFQQRRRLSYQGKKPAMSLASLFTKGSFLHIKKREGDFDPRRFRQIVFEPGEKRSLAAKLVLGFGMGTTSRHTVKSWDANQVFFLTNANGGDNTCERELPYALWASESANGQGLADNAGLSDAQSLTRLLMEIEYGLGFYLNISEFDDLATQIRVAIEEDTGRAEYLRAVEDCADFHEIYQDHADRLGGYQNPTALARIITGLQLAEQIRIAPLREGKRKDGSQRLGLAPGYESPYTPRPINQIPEPTAGDESEVASGAGAYVSSEWPPGAETSSSKWFTQLGKLARVLTSGMSEQTAPSPIKIAILDTGLVANVRKQIPEERYKDCIPSKPLSRETPHHGTDMFRVLRKVNSRAEVYVARVFESDDGNDDTPGLMKEAILHAVDTWGVDIIAMPSGFESFHQCIFNAIQRAIARAKPVLVFAAPGNSGNMVDVAFPARMYRDNEVIAMFATAADNKPVPRFNPAATPGARCNPAIFGEHVVIAKKTAVMGTSVSTMIGAGLAGLILAFAKRADVAARISMAESLRKPGGMLRVFKAMAVPDNGYDCVVPDGLLPKECSSNSTSGFEHVCNRIQTALGEMYSKNC